MDFKNEFSFLIGGKAGDGVKFAGVLLAGILNKLGYSIFVYDDYPSLITGGHNFSIVRASVSKIYGHREKMDVIIALSPDALKLHKRRTKTGTIFVYDSDIVENKGGLGLPMSKIVKENGLPQIARNTLAVAILAGICGIDFRIVKESIKESIPKKAKENIKIAEIGYKEGKKSGFKIKTKESKRKTRPLLYGNEAMGLGAAAAGLDFYIAYPMTPSSPLLHFIASKEEELGIIAVHPENEIGVITMAEGAAYAGKKAMIGTAGGGFALMTEALSLSGQAELPIVIFVGQRPAPATGVPTYTGQEDLNFVLNAGHGEFPRILLAPGDADEAFYLTASAINMAWKYQVPVILLGDKHLGESIFSVSFDKNKVKKMKPKLWQGMGEYKRYLETKDGISPMAFPGDKGAIIKANSYTHDEFGITTEKEDLVSKSVEKRIRKTKTIRQDIKKMETFKVYGNKKSSVLLITWGSTKGAVIEVAEKLGLKVLQILFLEPFISEVIKKEAEKAKKVFVAELNVKGQLAEILKNNGIKVDGKILKYNGRPFTVDELEEKIKKLL